MADKLILIDGNSILYRSFYALPPLALPDGRYTNAVYGFANIIIKTINEFKPTHMVVAFDVSKKTFRNEIFSDYKATRKPMPEELRSQIEPVKTMLKLMGIKILEKETLVNNIATNMTASTYYMAMKYPEFKRADHWWRGCRQLYRFPDR